MMDSVPDRSVSLVPRSVDVVPAAQVADVVAETQRTIDQLERDAADAKALADTAEDADRRSQANPALTTWTLVRLQRFLDELRREAARDAASMIEVARLHAQLRDGATPPLAASAVLAVPAPASAPEPSVAVAVAPERDALPMPWEVEVTPVVEAAPPVVPVVPVAPPVVAAPDAPPPIVAPPPPAIAPIVDMTSEPAVAPTRTVAPANAAAKRRGFRMLPLSVVLEVLAVVLVLVFIVLRLS